MIWCLCFLSLIITSLFGNESITFHDLEHADFHEKQVSIQGFLYKTSEGEWILSAEPNLKSCCVGSKDKIDRQIFLSGKLPNEPPLTAIRVQGKLTKMPRQERYAISDAILIEDKKFPVWLIGTCVALLFAIGILYCKRRSFGSPSGTYASG